ncbi:DivIVA domain-containing protein [Nocardioides lianchengensis]|uniref:Cell wall synthesis protein Wag31 n=1 Tax=Nocardioides lianchengensis TaxID=1045774 RepID=A0A1G6RDC3_9ACTN|nr:DivIVA domain-containing protein [Nocardioides lianchengensis]NYG10272.1 DivIVA domain-containing protein [Nocardioides lianchengensis]SDD02642.1 DivIVA domain-containing protein [Nocardioides lianchengensis]
MPITRADLAQQISNHRFTPRRREGYDMQEVDRFLDAVVAAVEVGLPVGDLVGRARFTPVRVREGYAMAEVDDFLRWIVDRTHELEERAPYLPDERSAAPQARSARSQRIVAVQFSPVRLREGYDMSEVDQLLDELAAAVDSGADVRTLAGEARFTRVRLREGYDMGEVDAFLREVVAEADGGRTATPDALPLPTVIQEQRGLLSRIFGGR